MKDKLFIVFVLLLSGMPALLFGQKGDGSDVSEKLVSYIVIKGDKLKNIAVRFQVSPHTLMQANKIKSKNYTAYPGMILRIPVKVQPKVWDPSKEDLTDAGILSEDRRPSADYEVIGEGFDYDIRDDFITTSDALDDSLQYEKVGTHMTKIDKRVNYLSFRIDSFKQVEFNFEYNEKDINSVLGRMKMARDKYYLNGPLGREIDSLNKIKAKLANLRIRLRSRLTEYEYLTDNARYQKENYERDEKNKDTHWGDQITYESNYLRSKQKHDELIAKTDTAPKISVDTTRQTPKPTVKDTLPSPALITLKKDTIPQSTSDLKIPPSKHQKIDFSLLPVRTSPIEIRHDKKELQLNTLPFVEKMVTHTLPDTTHTIAKRDTAIAPVKVIIATSDTVRKPAPVAAKDTIKKPAPVVAAPRLADTLHHTTTAIAPKIPIVKPTIAPTAKVPDTIHKATTALVPKKDSILKPSPTPVVKAADTIHKVITPLIKKDTIVKQVPIAVIKTADTTHTTAIQIKVDTAHLTVAAVKRDTTVKTIAAADHSIKPGAATKDTVIKTNLAIGQGIDSVKSTTAKATTTDVTIADATSRDTYDKTAKGKTKDIAPKVEQVKVPATKKSTDNKVVNTALEDNTIIKPIPAKDEEPKKPTPEPVLKRVQIEPAHVARLAGGIPTPYRSLITLDTKYDSIMLYREKKINQDPLASYKTDSNFVMTNVQLKEIPIIEVKNKPKYLIPVDSISQIKAEFYLIRARQVLEKGDFKEGDKFLRKSLDLNPNNAATWMLHADLCLTTGAADKALKEYAISGEIDSTNPKVFYNIALLYAKANDEQKAYKYFSRATDVNEKYLLAYMGRASVLMDTRDYEGAILDYDKVLGINKYYSPAYKGRALAKMEARRFPDAVVDFNQYLEIEDPDGYVLYERGIAKILANNLLQGCLDLSSALELGYKDAEKAIKKFCN